MRILGIDTSTGPASSALIEGGRLLAMHEDNEPMRQSQRLVGAVDALMRKNGGYDRLDAIAVCTGPGGFTGIRVGLAAARGLALACDIPLIGITSLEAFAWEALQEAAEGATCFACVNAFRQQAYIQPLRKQAGLLKALREAEAVDITALPLAAAAHPYDIATGNLVNPELAHYAGRKAPHARFIAAYGLALLEHNAAEAMATRPAEAHYIRPPDAKPQKPLF